MRRLWTFLIFMALFTVAYQLGSLTEIDVDDARKLLDEFDDLLLDIDALKIFVHNATLALLMFVPGFGVGWGLFSAWSTGVAFASIATIMPGAVTVSPLSILYFSPFGILELAAYSLGMSRSFILISLIVRKQEVRPHIKATLIEIAVAMALLLAAGFIEFYMIEMIWQGGLQMPSV